MKLPTCRHDNVYAGIGGPTCLGCGQLRPETSAALLAAVPTNEKETAVTPRYEIRDRHAPAARGMRFGDLARAKRELTHAVPAQRWFIFDRCSGAEVADHYGGAATDIATTPPTPDEIAAARRTAREEAASSGETTTVHYHAGHNDAGYLPEADVETFATFDDAKVYMIDELLAAADSMASWAEPHDCDDIPCPTYGDECPEQLANSVALEAESLNLEGGPEWLAYLSDGRPLPVAWWITPCSDTDCEIDEF